MQLLPEGLAESIEVLAAAERAAMAAAETAVAVAELQRMDQRAAGDLLAAELVDGWAPREGGRAAQWAARPLPAIEEVDDYYPTTAAAAADDDDVVSVASVASVAALHRRWEVGGHTGGGGGGVRPRPRPQQRQQRQRQQARWRPEQRSSGTWHDQLPADPKGKQREEARRLSYSEWTRAAARSCSAGCGRRDCARCSEALAERTSPPTATSRSGV